MEKEEIKCKNCRFWKQEFMEQEFMKELPLDSGLCYRFPPQGFGRFETIDSGKGLYKIINFIGQLQSVPANHWCGEFQSK